MSYRLEMKGNNIGIVLTIETRNRIMTQHGHGANRLKYVPNFDRDLNY